LELADSELGNIEVVYEDGQGDVKLSLTALKKLLEIDRVSAIFSGFSGVTQACAPTTEASKTILFGLGATAPGLSDIGKYVFRNSISATQEVEAMAKTIYTDLKYRNVALIYSTTETGAGAKEVFAKEFKGKLVAVESYLEGDKTFSTQLTKIKAQKPEAVFIVGFASEIGLILKQSRELRMDGIQWIALQDAENKKVIEIAGDAANGIIYSRPVYDPKDTSNRAMAQYSQKYLEKYGSESELYAAEAYDALHLIAKDIDHCGSDTPCIGQALLNTKNYSGASGIFSFEADGGVTRDLQLRTIKNGAFVDAKV
jgi:branched-chain amino acid transport system substrate-binding protein